MSKEKKHSFIYYLNPFVWIHSFVSYLLTFALIVNHFFVFLLGLTIIILLILFSYDRYAASTYDVSIQDGVADSIFLRHEKYDSPLAHGDKYLAKELEELHSLAPATAENAEDKTSTDEKTENPFVIQNSQPVWDRRDTVPRSFILEEVNRRMLEIQKKVLNFSK